MAARADLPILNVPLGVVPTVAAGAQAFPAGFVPKPTPFGIDFIGGTLIILGLFTRPVAFILCGEMAVAYLKAHLPGGLVPLQNHGEIAVLNCFIFLYLVFAGGGPWSVDALIARSKRGGLPGTLTG